MRRRPQPRRIAHFSAPSVLLAAPGRISNHGGRFDGISMHTSQLALKDLRNVAHKMRRSGLSQIEIGGNGYRVRLRFNPPAAALPAGEAITPSPAAASTDAQTASLRASMPGTVWLWHPSNGQPFAPLGSTVTQGEVLALLKVGLIFLPLRSPVDGAVDALRVAHGESVEYDSAILTLRKIEVSS